MHDQPRGIATDAAAEIIGAEADEGYLGPRRSEPAAFACLGPSRRALNR